MSRLEEYLSFYTSKGTKKNYRSFLRKYFLTFWTGEYDDKGKPIDFSLNDEIEQYFQEERDHDADMRKFYASVKDYAPKTTKVWVNIAKNFLEENNVEISKKVIKRINRARGTTRAISQDRVPSKEEMRRIFSHLPLRGRAFYTCLASSGMRIGEAAQVLMEDLNIETVPAEIQIQAEYTKSKVPRTVYLSAEAVELVAEWLRVREGYIERNTNDGKERVFPITRYGLSKMFNGAVKKAGLFERDKRTKRQHIHPHCMRKYFRTELAKAVPVDIVEDIMGHEGYLTQSYRKYSDEHRRNAYLEGEYTLTIFGDTTAMQKEIESKTSELKSTVTSIVGKSLTMESEMAELKRSNDKLVDLVGKLIAEAQKREREDQEWEMRQRAEILESLR